MFNKAQLVKLIQDNCLEFGDFTLKSGAKSKFYLDLRKLTLSHHVAVVAQAIAYTEQAAFDAIGGPCVGADPIVGAYLSMYGGAPSCGLRGFLVRKEEKDHGKAERVIGSLKLGDRCLIVEDVGTTGGSLLQAVACVTEFGATVVQAVTIVDRGAGAAEACKAANVPYRSLLTLQDLGIEV